MRINNLKLVINGNNIINIPGSFGFEHGKITSILGYSGSGKSSLLKSICGIHKASGEILIGEEDINKLPINKREISIVFQDSTLFPNMTVLENLLVVCDDVSRIVSLTERLKIDKLLSKHPSMISGGESQRVCIARALLSNNSIILLDEPFSSLDYLTKLIVREVVKDEINMRIKTCLFVTHDRDDAFYMSETGVIMDNGEITRSAKLKTLYDKPKSYNDATLLGDGNVINFNNERILVRPEWFKITHSLSGIEVVDSNEMGYYKKLIISSFHRLVAFDFLNTYKKGDKVKLEILRKSLIKESANKEITLDGCSWISCK